MPDLGFRISQKNWDAITDTDDSHMMASSKVNNIKIAKVVDFNNISNSAGTFVYSNVVGHGLGYVPSHMAFERLHDDPVWQPMGDQQFQGLGNLYVTDGSVYCSSAINYGGGATPIDVRSFLFIEQLAGDGSATPTANNLGIKIMRPNKDIASTDDRDTSFSSKHQCLNVVQSGTVILNCPAGEYTASISVPHSLGYSPVSEAYLVSGGSTVSSLPTNNVVSPEIGDYLTGTGIEWVTLNITSASISIIAVQTLTFQDNYNITLQYYIYQTKLS